MPDSEVPFPHVLRCRACGIVHTDEHYCEYFSEQGALDDGRILSNKECQELMDACIAQGHEWTFEAMSQNGGGDAEVVQLRMEQKWGGSWNEDSLPFGPPCWRRMLGQG